MDAKPRAKFGNKKTPVDGILFDSAKEANRYGILKMLLRAGKITDLECQPVFEIYIQRDTERIRIGDFTPDFRYYTNGECIVEDVKGGKATKTTDYQLRKKLTEAIYSIVITEI